MFTECTNPGHGGKQPGAAGNGIIEKDWALAFCLKHRAEMEKQYIVKSVLTRGNDSNLELSKRDDVARNLRAKAYTSIHLNGFHDSSANGFETFIHPNCNQATKEMQKIIHSEIMEYLRPFGIKDRGIKTANFQELRENTAAKMPAVLIEFLFLSNPREAALLKDPKFVDGLNQALCRGKARAFGLSKRALAEVKVPGVIHRVQVGAFNVRENAEKLVKELKSKDFPAAIVLSDDNKVKFRVQIGAYGYRSNADLMENSLNHKGYQAFIVTVKSK